MRAPRSPSPCSRTGTAAATSSVLASATAAQGSAPIASSVSSTNARASRAAAPGARPSRVFTAPGTGGLANTQITASNG